MNTPANVSHGNVSKAVSAQYPKSKGMAIEAAISTPSPRYSMYLRGSRFFLLTLWLCPAFSLLFVFRNRCLKFEKVLYRKIPFGRHH